MTSSRPRHDVALRAAIMIAALALVGLFLWQGITAGGVPDPLQLHDSAKFPVVIG